jgi:hypothetical protein
MMKTILLPTIICLLAALLRGAAAISCPEELPGKVELPSSGLTLYYGVLKNEEALCGKLESNSEAWMGFGAQPAGTHAMVGAHAIIVLPTPRTVQQYMLNGKSASQVVLAEKQTLTETSVTNEGGKTIATFKQPLDDDGLKLTSTNVYLLAIGRSNELGYHLNRGFVTLDFEKNIITSTIGSTKGETELALDLNLRGQAIRFE